MSLDEKFNPIRTAIYEIVGNVFKTIAGLFGYPNNPGMVTVYEMPSDLTARARFIQSLPKHESAWPPIQRPETLFEVIFGDIPKPEPVPRYVYETKEEGFYNFFIENYKNIYFLPDWLSEFIQVRLHICLDISVLEITREVLFLVLVIYSQLVSLRIALAWLLYINPYTMPWCYLIAAVDWSDEILQGIIPSVLGVNATGTIFLGLLGSVADNLNHLVFTMPFLPSEAERTKLLLNQEMRDVLVFHYLPITWYRHPIPNDLREFWYYERPDILEYMQRAYKDLGIQFLPDNIIQELNQKSDGIISQSNNISNYISTEILSKETLFDLSVFLKSLSFHFLF
jgi:hypothetical protein